MKENEIINYDTFINYMNMDKLTKEEELEIKEYQDHMEDSLKYKQYLVGEHKEETDKYTRVLNEALEDIDTYGEKMKVSQIQKKALDKYSQTLENAKEFNNEKQNKENQLRLKKEKKSGYVNAFYVVLTTLLTGIAMGIAIYFTK